MLHNGGGWGWFLEPSKALVRCRSSSSHPFAVVLQPSGPLATYPSCSSISTMHRTLVAMDALGRIASVFRIATFSGDMQTPVNCNEGLSV